MAVVLAVSMALSAVALGALGGWLLMHLVARWLLPRRDQSPRTRALLLAQLRLAPLAGAVLLASAQARAFVLYEGSSHGESVGVALVLLAGAGLVMVFASFARAWALWRNTRAVERAWRAAATPLHVHNWPHPAWVITPGAPVVAVAGAIRPELFVADVIVSACSADELAAIAAHEQAHVRRRDNLMRWLFHITPGVSLFPRLSATLDAAWLEASEQAADHAGARSSSPLMLAAALTKVARLAIVSPRERVQVAAFAHGSDLARRVSRLLDQPRDPLSSPAAWAPLGMVVVVALALHASGNLRLLHELFEYLVRRG